MKPAAAPDGGQPEAETAGQDRISRRAMLASLASVLTMKSAGQQQSFKAEVQVVNVLATVRRRSGQIVRDLTREDFTIEQDGQPQTIRYFARETERPLTLGLLVDVSAGQRRFLNQQRMAGSQFLNRVFREDRDLAFVIQFDRDVELVRNLTSSRSQLHAALRQVGMRPGPAGRPAPRPQPGVMPRGAALYDAVLLAAEELMKNQAGLKSLIVLSGGLDHASKVGLPAAIEAAQRADTSVFSVAPPEEPGYRGGFPPASRGRRRRTPQRLPPEAVDGKGNLIRLCRATGGAPFEVSAKHPWEEIVGQIAGQLRSQYNLGYTPEGQDAAPGYHRVRVGTRLKGLVVQAREGYYASRARP